ncbi:LuxR C-terminal-related transcriptional regulator [Paraburkholderia kirstenboschensis]|uniref:LuxR C-terminal-related transcriptional regulator n=1 Tax=Paraburkholderia kirstenboschensis TaxID=1245436 RepID=A0ABZ0EFH2_9BURK|nr:LuxR C-terminal-related transcriptional regulator [Paraburkholderia kirstenboschensis]WOD15976.1 LuxR C-terminal-related transcriptional regulator [Paraburkholderia kirstenboschensis]
MASTRFAPPRIGSKTIRRTDLLTQLQRAPHATLALVTASAGYGKTTLLAQWRETCVKAGAEVAWLSLSADENSYTGFCSALFMAMQRVGLRAGPDLLFEDASPAGADALVALLVDGVLDLAKEIYVFIDDYHFVDAALVHRFMQKLLDQAPGTLHLVIASRSAPPFALSRLRMMNQFAELDSASLPFVMAETRIFVEENLGKDKLPADDLRLIHDVTGGWPSCVQLIVVMLKNRPQSLGTLRDLAWRHGDLQTYLSEEVMANLPPGLVAFAEALSLFRRFSAPLARHVTRNPNAGDLLKRMEDENLLISRIDSDERLAWYRFHPLLGEFLAARLTSADPAGALALHLCASNWFADHGYLAEALRHASVGGDHEFAAEVIERAEPVTWSLEYLSPMLHLLERLPEATLVRHRRLLFIACLTIALTTRTAKATEWLAHLESGGMSEDAELTNCIPLIYAAIAFQNDDTPRMLELLEPLRDMVIQNPFLRYLLVAELCVAYAACGRYADARRQLDLRAVSPADRDNDMALVVESARVAALLGEGDVREAERLGTPLLARSVNAAGRHSIGANICASVLVDAYYELDRIDDARETIANRPGLLRASGPDITIRASLCRARLDLLQVSADVALAFLEQQTAHLRNLQQSRAVAHMLAEQIRILLLKNNSARAAELGALLDELAQAHYTDQGVKAEIPAVAALTRARVLRATQPESALDALLFVRERAKALGRGRLHALANLLSVTLLVELGRTEEAKPVLAEAVEAGARLGLVRTFIDEGTAAAALFERVLAEKWLDGAQSNYVAALLERFSDIRTIDNQPAAKRRGNSDRAQPTLTQRELEILALVAHAMSNKRIALALNITLETVKWNLRNVFAKLGVSSRYDAMLWARKNGFIE